MMIGLTDKLPKQGKVKNIGAYVEKLMEDLSVWIGKVEESRDD